MDQSNSSQSGATGIMARLRDGATSQVSQQKDTATKGLGSIAQAARQTTQQLREQQHDTIAEYIEKAADRLEKFSSDLSSRSVSDSDERRSAVRAAAAGTLRGGGVRGRPPGCAISEELERQQRRRLDGVRLPHAP